jgi:hypothetical protein
MHDYPSRNPTRLPRMSVLISALGTNRWDGYRETHAIKLQNRHDTLMARFP